MEAPPTEDSNMEVEQSNNTEVQDVQQENSLNIPSKECVKSDHQVQNKESSSNEEVGENSVDNNDTSNRQNGTADQEESSIDEGMEVVEESSQETLRLTTAENTEAEESQDGLAIIKDTISQNNDDIADTSSKGPHPGDSNGPVDDSGASKIENVSGEKHVDSEVQMLDDSQDNCNNFNVESSNAGSNGKQPNLESSEDNSQDLQISSVTTEKINDIDEDSASTDFGLKISSIASESKVGGSEVTEQNSINEEDNSETSNNDTTASDTGIKISSFASSVNNDLSKNQEGSKNTESENTGIKISNIAHHDVGEESLVVEEDSQEDQNFGLKISSIASETENSSGLKISSIASTTDDISNDDVMEIESSGDKNTETTGLKISSIASENANTAFNSDDDDGPGLQISSVSSQSSKEKENTENSGEKSDNDQDSGLRISSIASEASSEKKSNNDDDDVEAAKENDKTHSESGGGDTDSNGQQQTAGSGLKISAIASVESLGNNKSTTSDETSDEATTDKDKEKTDKPVLKLASFAGMSSNGISAADIVDDPADDEVTEPVTGQCALCEKDINGYKSAVVWETMQFCQAEKCLTNFQEKMSNCATCKTSVQVAFVGKYCVRFGASIKQFCSNKCLEDHKKGLKVCCYCQKDISNGDGFLAPIGNKGQFKDFCVQICLKKYEARQAGKTLEKEVKQCKVCSENKLIESELETNDGTIDLCSEICLGAYKFANSLTDTSNCDLCKKNFVNNLKTKRKIYFSGKSNQFCSEACQNVFVMQSREIVPCSWCKVRKYNFDMIEKYLEDGTQKHLCSLNCFSLFSKNTPKSSLKSPAATQSSIRPISISSSTSMADSIPVIQSVSSLAGAGEPPARPDMLPTQPIPATQLPATTIQPTTIQQQQAPPPPPPPQVITRTTSETMVKFPDPPAMKNKSVGCKPFMATKGVSCRPHPCHKGTQTDLPSVPSLLPITMPMYFPVPMQMYQRPYPVPIPVPVPVPVPIFIPTTRNSYRGVEKTMKKIRAKMPSDPLEAELLALAGGLDTNNEVDSDSDDSLPGGIDDKTSGDLDDIDLKDVPKFTEDLENMMSGTKIVPKALPKPLPEGSASVNSHPQSRQHNSNKAIKRRHSGRDETDDEDEYLKKQRANNAAAARNRRSRQKSSVSTPAPTQQVAAFPQPPKERPDAKHHLKFTYGVNAWRHWVVGKNAELEKARSQGKYIKPFETDILKLRADELNYTLCMFVKEVRKPNGDIYAADSILYLAMGIQEYLFENGRIDNIFTDTYYDAFTTALHEVIKEFKLPTNEMGYFVTRIEEEHLWEAKQLGAHSPQVLLNTLIYFNTKYFMLKTIEEHQKLAFTHIMKHYKQAGKANPVSRGAVTTEKQSLLLRYYPPSDRGRQHDRKCYEQHEIPDPTRCPVKLYEFYLSKCPENVRARNDIFYLQPERSCVPDSPVWFSTSDLNQHQIDKMLRRVLMVREVQEHMLADSNQ